MGVKPISLWGTWGEGGWGWGGVMSGDLHTQSLFILQIKIEQNKECF